MSMFFDMIYGKLGVLLFVTVALITVLAVIRSLIKMKNRKAINITPVGVFNDLPESVTGISKSKEWEIKEEGENQISNGLKQR